MTPRLRILSNVIERLGKLNTAVTGHLYGVMCESALTVLTFSVNSISDEETMIKNVNLQLNMPVEVDLLGVLFVDQCEQKIPDAFEDIDVTDNPLILKYSINESSLQPFFYIHQKLESAGDFEIVSEEYISQHFFYIRLQASFPLVAEREKVADTLQAYRKNLALGKVGFFFPNSHTYLFGNDANDTILKDSTVKEVLSTGISHKQEFPTSYKNIFRSSSRLVDAIPVEMLLKLSNDKNNEGSVKHAPVIHQERRSYNYLQLNLKIDAPSLVGQNSKLSGLYEILVESVCRNLRLIGESFEEQTINENSEMRIPVPMHFKPLDIGHLITVAYPAGSSSVETMEYRKSLHKTLALSLTKPEFRTGNVVKFQHDLKIGEPLFNPHEAISRTNTPSGKLSFVYGCYSYYHYLQDNIDDNGWGCAYRSLQTIVSWYRLQGYTEREIPTHTEIQKCLVDIGDKPASFIGSKQWIGSTEVGFVLETLLNVSIKILRALSGDEMSSLVPNLAYHFETQGTPVMIGGGVLAHTILGVSSDDTTGEVRYLILDPHYTGSEELNTIINKGWCGWKTNNFWKKGAFYNMCLPQRPFCF